MDIATKVPARWRAAIYTVLAMVSAVQAVWAPLPADEWGRVVSCLALLGFGLARGNVDDR